MKDIQEVINGTGPASQQEASALAAAACQGIVDPIAHDHFVSELTTALSMIELEEIVGGGDVVRDYARELLKKIEAATANG